MKPPQSKSVENTPQIFPQICVIVVTNSFREKRPTNASQRSIGIIDIEEIKSIVLGPFLGQDLRTTFVFFMPKVFFATLCGLMIGMERHRKDRPAGIKTSVMVCVGSAIFSGVAMLLAENFHDIGLKDNFRVPMFSDPARIIAQLVTGVGFIGAGVIFKFHNRVSGITTAALIWTVCAIGVVVGLGGYVIAVALALGLVVSLFLLERIETALTLRQFRRMGHRRARSMDEHDVRNLRTSLGENVGNQPARQPKDDT